MATASWFHSSMKTVSRSAGRSVVAAAAYRLGEKLYDELHGVTHDYTRRKGVENAFTVAPRDAPEWAHDPAKLWNAAEQAEKRKNSTVGREIELALPSFLGPEDRQRMAREFAGEIVDRYGVAVSVAIHEPGKGDERNYHAHVLFTTREMTPHGLGKKTRILDDQKTGPQQAIKLRELAADIINRHLAAAHSDIRVDHRSFKERGIERQPTTHLGPAASDMERRGELTDRGDINREAKEINAKLDEVAAIEGAIEERKEIIAAPPKTREDSKERVRGAAAPMARTIRQHGALHDRQRDGLTWWQRAALYLGRKARKFALALKPKLRAYSQAQPKEGERRPGSSTWRDKALNREQGERGFDR